MRTKTRCWASMGMLAVTLWGCASSGTDATSGSGVTAAGASAVSAAAGGTALASAGSSAQLPVAEKCPQLPAAQGFRFTACCQPDNTCGVDATSLNRGCMSYAAFTMYFHFKAPAPTTCDGVPIASGTAAAGAGATR